MSVSWQTDDSSTCRDMRLYLWFIVFQRFSNYRGQVKKLRVIETNFDYWRSILKRLRIKYWTSSNRGYLYWNSTYRGQILLKNLFELRKVVLFDLGKFSQGDR